MIRLTFIDSESTADQYSPKDGSEKQDHFPVSRIVCTHELQLSVKVQGEEDEAGKPGGRVAGREGLEGIIDRLLVSSTDRPVVHVIGELRARGWGKLGHIWHADGIKVRTKAPDKPLDKNL